MSDQDEMPNMSIEGTAAEEDYPIKQKDYN